jgi:hypothetical protein
LLTATAGVAIMTGAAGALSATGVAPTTILPPVGVAVSGNCHLTWQYRGSPDRATGRRWVHKAATALEFDLARIVEERVAALGSAVEMVASDAVDHGVLLA